MNPSIRTISSLAQFLQMLGISLCEGILIKHQIDHDDSIHQLPFLIESLCLTSSDKLISVLNEIEITHGDLRYQVNPRYRFDERWRELELSLELDGYRMTNGSLIEIEPSLPEQVIMEDDLTDLIESSSLDSRKSIVECIGNSTRDYMKMPPDYNGCLANVRIALETLAKEISGEATWGNAIKQLREREFISIKQEKGIAGVYTFISDGTHNPVSLDEKEMARLGRSLALNMCYFLVRILT